VAQITHELAPPSGVQKLLHAFVIAVFDQRRDFPRRTPASGLALNHLRPREHEEALGDFHPGGSPRSVFRGHQGPERPRVPWISEADHYGGPSSAASAIVSNGVNVPRPTPDPSGQLALTHEWVTLSLAYSNAPGGDRTHKGLLPTDFTGDDLGGK
jgi:hypothetical protein